MPNGLEGITLAESKPIRESKPKKESKPRKIAERIAMPSAGAMTFFAFSNLITSQIYDRPEYNYALAISVGVAVVGAVAGYFFDKYVIRRIKRTD